MDYPHLILCILVVINLVVLGVHIFVFLNIKRTFKQLEISFICTGKEVKRLYNSMINKDEDEDEVKNNSISMDDEAYKLDIKKKLIDETEQQRVLEKELKKFILCKCMEHNINLTNCFIQRHLMSNAVYEESNSPWLGKPIFYIPHKYDSIILKYERSDFFKKMIEEIEDES